MISGDEVDDRLGSACPCGQTSVAFEHDIIRYSEKQGVEDDRITCAATHEVHNEAVNFMTGVRVVSAHSPFRCSCAAKSSTDDLVPFGTRGGGTQFQAPDMAQSCRPPAAGEPDGRWPTSTSISFDEILDVLEALGDALDFDTNTHLQQAYEAALRRQPTAAGRC